MVNGLCIASELGIRRLEVRGDSQLVVTHVMKEASCRDEKMAGYCREIWKIEEKFDGTEIHQIARQHNEAADALARIASAREPVPPGVFISDQWKPSVRYNEIESRADQPINQT